MIVFACTSCQKKLSIKDELGGKKIKCPVCAAVTSVPAMAKSAGSPSTSFDQTQNLPATLDKPTVLRDRTASVPAMPEVAGGSTGAFERTQGLPGAPEKPSVPRGDVNEATQPFSGSIEGTRLPAAEREEDTSLTDFLAPPGQEGELGRLGSYRVLRILGHGGMGVVFEGEDTALGRRVAIKAMLPHVARNKASQERFLREARTAAHLEHDNIVAIYHVGQEGGAPFIVMPFLKGEPLDQRLQRENNLPLADLCRIGREIAQGLGAAHAKGLIHRDIKPANVWLETRDEGQAAKGEQSSAAGAGSQDPTLPFAPQALPPRVKLLDFGLARAAAQESGITQQGVIVGTPAYMSPEQARGLPVDQRCDLWSLGVVLYRMCTGTLPFHGTDGVSTLMAVMTVAPQTPSQLDPDIPGELSALVMKLLEKDVADRFASAQEVVQKLANLEEQVRQDGTVYRLTLATEEGTTGSRTEMIQQTEMDEPSVELTLDTSDAAGPETGTKPASRRRLPLALAAVLVAVVAGVALHWFSPWDAGKGGKAEVRKPSEDDGNKDATEGGDAGAKNPLESDAALPVHWYPLESLESKDIPPALQALVAVPGKGLKTPYVPREVVAVLGNVGFDFAMPGKKARPYASANGKLLAAPCGATVAVFDVPAGQRLHTLDCKSGEIRAASMSADGKLLAVYSWPKKPPVKFGEIKLFDLAEGKSYKTINWDGTISTNPMEFSPDGKHLVIGRLKPGPALLVYDARSGEQYGSVQTAHWSGKFNPDGTCFASVYAPPSGSEDGHAEDSKVIVWETREWSKKRILDADHRVSLVCFSGDGKYLAAGEGRTPETSRVTIWTTDNFAKVNSFKLPPFHVFDFLAGGEAILIHQRRATDQQAHAFSVWEVGSGRKKSEFSHDGPTDYVFFTLTADRKDLVICHQEKLDHLLVVDPETGKEHNPRHGHTGSVNALAFDPDGAFLASASSDGTVKLWDLATLSVQHTFRLEAGDRALSMGLSPSGKTIAVGSALGRIRLWDVPSRKELPPLEGHKGSVRTLACSPDGRRIATAGSDRRVKLWDVTTGHNERTFDYDVTGLVFSPDGQTLAAAAADGKIRRFGLDGKELPVLENLTGQPIRSIAFRGNGGNSLVAGDEGFNINDWDLNEGKIQKFVGYHKSGPAGTGIVALAGCSDSRFIASSGGDGAVRLWDFKAQTFEFVNAGKPDVHKRVMVRSDVFAQPAASGNAASIALTRDGRYLAIGGEKGLIQILRTLHGRQQPPDRFTNKLGMEFVRVSKGKSWLGGGRGGAPGGEHSPGTNDVSMPYDFYLGRYEVTQQQWREVMGGNPSSFAPGGQDGAAVKQVAPAVLQRFPVESVTWDEAREFADRLGSTLKETGWSYRLPTQPEWEYACRGGPLSKEDSAFDYYLDKPLLALPAARANLAAGGKKRPERVGCYEPNKLGLCDMHGNVAEWVGDEAVDPNRPDARIACGGAWADQAADCQAASRILVERSARKNTIGLRLVRAPVGSRPIEPKRPPDPVGSVEVPLDRPRAEQLPPALLARFQEGRRPAVGGEGGLIYILRMAEHK